MPRSALLLAMLAMAQPVPAACSMQGGAARLHIRVTEAARPLTELPIAVVPAGDPTKEYSGRTNAAGVVELLIQPGAYDIMASATSTTTQQILQWKVAVQARDGEAVYVDLTPANATLTPGAPVGVDAGAEQPRSASSVDPVTTGAAGASPATETDLWRPIGDLRMPKTGIINGTAIGMFTGHPKDKLFLDPSVQSTPAGAYAVRTKHVYKKPRTMKIGSSEVTVAYRVVRAEIDCSERRARFTGIELYDGSSELRGYDNSPSPWVDPWRFGIGEAEGMYDWAKNVCKALKDMGH